MVISTGKSLYPGSSVVDLEDGSEEGLEMDVSELNS
jgi:hypothetical protein